MERVALTPFQVDHARMEVPPPEQHTWELDPALSGDRLRLFRDSDIGGGEVGAAYADGRWYISDPNFVPTCVADGRELTLIGAMKRILLTAPHLGWGPWPLPRSIFRYEDILDERHIGHFHVVRSRARGRTYGAHHVRIFDLTGAQLDIAEPIIMGRGAKDSESIYTGVCAAFEGIVRGPKRA